MKGVFSSSYTLKDKNCSYLLHNLSTEDKPVRFLLISVKPIKEPVASYGPIVMNTQEELRIAFEEYQNGTFIKKR